MDEVITHRRGPATFNGPLEAGVRSVALLCAAYPRSYDLQRLIALDYLLVHTGDIGGPDSLHPPAPLQSAELLVRRRLIERALLLMMTRDLVRREARSDGIHYSAGESAMPYIEALQSDYIRALKQRAAWLVNTLGDHTEAQFKRVMRHFFDRWVEEFPSSRTQPWVGSMSIPGIRLRHLAFHGPGREPATVAFGPGLNVIYGASDTGKSFIVEAIDFMLGGRGPLRDMPERVGYDRVLLGIETMSGDQFTLSRSVDGGRFRLFPGLRVELPTDASTARDLADQHNERSPDNLSMFLLELCGLNGRRVRKNKAGDTVSLSFRNLARLMIVTETEIMAQRSPLSDGNPVVDTPNFATFKLLLTGVDDSALVPRKAITPEDQSREAQIDLLDQLIDEYHKRVRELARDPDELDDQLVRLEETLSQHVEQLATTEAEYRQIVNRRREVRERLEAGRDRRSEVTGLLERFELLDQHYNSDLARLRGIEEAGTLFGILGQGNCPLCGSAPEHHLRGESCDGDVDAVVAAARSEIAKIELLRKELADTREALTREGRGFDRRLPRVESELDEISARVDRLISPRLTRLRANYGDVANKRGEVREALSVYRTFLDMQRRREALEKADDEKRGSSVSDGDLPLAIAEAFALKVEAILKDWHFPEAERVFFDAKQRDLVIAGKLRTARGKGLRAITHAAFTVGLLEYCRERATPHPGFVCFDSPLLAYRAPEGVDDDLSGTDLNECFYHHLARLAADQQVIVIENRDPPNDIIARPQTQMFSRNAAVGRFGFFPLVSNIASAADGADISDLPPAN